MKKIFMAALMAISLVMANPMPVNASEKSPDNKSYTVVVQSKDIQPKITNFTKPYTEDEWNGIIDIGAGYDQLLEIVGQEFINSNNLKDSELTFTPFKTNKKLYKLVVGGNEKDEAPCLAEFNVIVFFIDHNLGTNTEVAKVTKNVCEDEFNQIISKSIFEGVHHVIDGRESDYANVKYPIDKEEDLKLSIRNLSTHSYNMVVENIVSKPTSTPEPTKTPDPEATSTPESTTTPQPTETVEPTATPTPETTTTPESTKEPETTVDPTATPEVTTTPEVTVEPTLVPTIIPTEEPVVTVSPIITPTVAPDKNEQGHDIPKTGDNKKPNVGLYSLILIGSVLALIKLNKNK